MRGRNKAEISLLRGVLNEAVMDNAMDRSSVELMPLLSFAASKDFWVPDCSIILLKLSAIYL
jgi:hypothetical protein